jgi:thiosulfate dehydrogenase
MLRGFVFGVLATILAALLCGYLLLRSGLIPANADGKPLWLEVWAAQTSLGATLRREAPKGPNPVPLTPDNLIAGIKLYGQHCAICHGTAQGKASASPLAKGLYTPPPQLGTAGVERDPPGATFWKIQHGIRWTAMPAWKATLSDRQMWTLALFLKHMNNLPPAAQEAWQELRH